VQYRALLIDLDGVVRRWRDDDAALEQRCGLPAGALRGAAFAPELLQAAITGAVKDEVWRAGVIAALQRRYPQSRADEAVARWSAPVGEVDAAVMALLTRRRAQVRVVLATNATTRLDADLRVLGLADAFHAVANSSELGFAKPDERYFHGALALAGVHASEALFVDDSRGNVQAAAGIGMHAHHFTGVDALTEFLVGSNALNNG
jgi:HAD superfamily hydrolase (TIGR01509 family)